MAYNIYLPITCVDCGTWWLQSDCLWCITIKDVQEQDKRQTNGF